MSRISRVALCWALLAGGASAALAAEPRLEWARVRNQAFLGSELASDLAPRPGGGVVALTTVAGSGDAAAKVTALAPDGETDWVALHQIPAGHVFANRVESDAEGHVWVVGSWREGPELIPNSPSPFNAVRFLALRYSPEGERMVEARIATPGSATALAVDPATGDAIFAGRCPIESCSQNIVVHRLAIDGEVVWSVEYDGPRGLVDRVAGLVIDPFGVIYLVGTVDEDPDDEEFTPFASLLVQAYLPNGERIWEARLNGGGYSSGGAVAVDRDVVYAAGTTRRSGGSYWHLTVAYDAESGEELWQDILPSPRVYDWERRIVVAPEGEVLVAGESLLSRYAEDGRLAWSVPIDFRVQSALAAGRDGSVYVAGSLAVDDGDRTDGVLARLSSQGSEEWRRAIAGQRRREAWFADLEPDGRGGVLALAAAPGPHPRLDTSLRSYSAEGALEWERRRSDPIDSSFDRGRAIALTVGGDVVVGADLARDIGAVRYSAGGEELWAARLESISPDGATAGLVVSPETDSLTLVGRSTRTYVDDGGGIDRHSMDMDTLRFDSEGVLEWSARAGSEGYDWGAAIVGAPEGGVVVAGRLQDRAGFIAVAYDAAGQVLWEGVAEGAIASGAVAIARSPSGRFAVTGWETAQPEPLSRARKGFLTLVLDADGREVWTRRVRGSSEREHEARHVAVDADDNVYVLGVSGPEILLVSYDRDGEELWRFASAGERPAGLLVDESRGRVACCFAVRTARGDLDVALASLGTDGALEWQVSWGGEAGGDDVPGALALSLGGELVATGSLTAADSGVDLLLLGARLDGEIAWTRTFVGEGELEDRGEALAIGADGSIAATGLSGPDMLTVSWRVESPSFVRGDCNGDGGRVDLADAVFLLWYAFLGGAVPPCLAACDSDGDGSLGAPLADAIHLLDHLFRLGPPPPAPYPACGLSTRPGDAALGCLESGC